MLIIQLEISTNYLYPFSISNKKYSEFTEIIRAELLDRVKR